MDYFLGIRRNFLQILQMADSIDRIHRGKELERHLIFAVKKADRETGTELFAVHESPFQRSLWNSPLQQP